MKLLAIFMFLGVGVAVSSAIYFPCMGKPDGENPICGGRHECKNQECVFKEHREKRSAIGSPCKTDTQCSSGHFCLFGYCSSNGTKNTVEHLKTAKRIRTHKKLATKKIKKRSISWPHCVDDFECKIFEKCLGGVCRIDGPRN
uniref:Uncharacterized protein n=1 Tax=Panagrolaimus sp. ES5 TaxID=591445 RepID=A0AC34FT85_9BILA